MIETPCSLRPQLKKDVSKITGQANLNVCNWTLCDNCPIEMMQRSRQTERTREAIKTAFAELVFVSRYDEIRMTDVARAANVGRSTLYLHFPDKDAILRDNLAPFLDDLAASLEGPTAQPKIEAVLHHVWSHRDRGRKVMFGTTGQKLETDLAARIAEILPDRSDTLAAPFLANAAAASIFAIIRTWLKGEASAAVDEIARHICLSSQTIVTSVR